MMRAPVKWTLGLLLMIFPLTAFISVRGEDKDQDVKLDAPPEVLAVLETSCFDCHLSGSENEKARDKLSFDKLHALNQIKQISKMNGIQEVISDGSMPPKKYLNYYPDRKLTPEQAELITKWARARSEAFMELP